MRLTLETGFVLAAVVLLVASMVALAVAPAAAEETTATPIDADVPDEYAFEEPSEPGVATVDGQRFGSLQAAVDAAEPGDTVVLSGRFDERVVVDTPDLTLTSRPGELAVIDGGGTGDVLTLNAANTTIRRVWVRNSGYDAGDNDAGIWLNASGASVIDSRVTAVTFGVWIDGVPDVEIANNTIVGREDVRPLSYRGNGIQIWRTERVVIRDNRITDVRDGLYYAWASEVVATGNTLWDLRYGVHYMYSDDSRLEGNVAFDNDAGYALMISRRLVIRDNVAVNNTGTSGHGILLKSVDDTEITGNELVGNGRGIYLYNSNNNTLEENLVLGNELGVYLAAGSVDEHVVNNSFVRNGQPVLAVMDEQVDWNGSGRGNFWSGARDGDVDHDGISEVRYRPAGLVEHLVFEHPEAAVFAGSPAFDAIRLAQSTVPVIDSPGVIDHYPLDRPAHDHWRRYYARD